MSDDVFRQNRPSPGCPSVLAISLYVAGDLDASAAASIEEHLAGCTCCRKLVEREREQSRAVITAPVPPLFSTRARSRCSWGPWSFAAAAVSAAALALAVWILPGTEPRPEDGTGVDGTRVKGDLALTATLLRGETVVFEGRDLAEMATLADGDRLRLRVSGAGAGQLVLSGCEPSGCQLLFRGQVPPGGAIPVGVRATAGESRLELLVCPDIARLDRALSSPEELPGGCLRRVYPIRVTQGEAQEEGERGNTQNP